MPDTDDVAAAEAEDAALETVAVADEATDEMLRVMLLKRLLSFARPDDMAALAALSALERTDAALAVFVMVAATELAEDRTLLA